MIEILIIILISATQVCCVSRAYPKGCSRESPEYYTYDSLPFPPPNLPARSHDNYALLRRLGAGKFSDVFEAVEVTEDTFTEDGNSAATFDPMSLCVIKCLKPVSERKIKRELLVLSHVSKLPNLARLKAVVLPSISTNSRNQQQLGSVHQNDGKMPSLVLEHAGPNARWLCHGIGCDPTSLSPEQKSGMYKEGKPYYLTEFEIKYYLCHLLIALDALHSRGIMHRDIKPRNVLMNRQWPPRKGHNIDSGSLGLTPPPLMLIDLGLADFYLPNQNYNVRVASRHYKAPELLVGNEFYDYGIDMWGVGCILAGLLLRREPLFRGKDNIDQLGKIVAVLGSRDLFVYIEKIGLELSKDLNKVIRKYTVRNNPSGLRKPWLSLLATEKDNKNGGPTPIPCQEGLNLLDKLLVYDHEHRLTAREAMMHPFFDDVREIVGIEVQERWTMEHRGRKSP